jgi:hypothetical protein
MWGKSERGMEENLKKQILEGTTLPTSLTLFNNTASVALTAVNYVPLFAWLRYLPGAGLAQAV